MTLKEIENEIGKDFKYRYISNRCIQIDNLEVMLNWYNFAYVALIEVKGKVILTDFADTLQLFPDATEDDVRPICKKYGLQVNNWHIECEYKSNEDIKNYFKAMDEIGNYFDTDSK